MNRDEFWSLCRSPGLVMFDHSQELKGIIDLYPYFQAARTLFTIAQKKGQQIGYSDAVKSTALYSSNRRTLFNLLEGNSLRATQPEDPKQFDGSVLDGTLKDVEAIEEETKEGGIQEDEQNKNISASPKVDKIEEKELPLLLNDGAFVKEAYIPERIETQKKQATESVESHSFLGWLNQFKQIEQITPEPNPTEHKKSKEEIIEEFIKTEPRISAPEKKEFYSPIGMAKKSVLDSEEIVSETLASIYANQGNMEKAIRIYQKLSLLYPEKISYFAALIKKLENPDIS